MNTARLAAMGAAALVAFAGFAHAAAGPLQAPVALVAAQPSGAAVQVVGGPATVAYPRTGNIVAVSTITAPSVRSTWGEPPSQRESIYSALIGSGRQSQAAEKPEAVPLPGALWLFGSALLAFLGISARRRF